MGDFNLEIIEPLGYNDRSKKSQKFNVLIAFGLFAFVSVLSDWEYGLVIAIVFFAVQYSKSSRWDKYFITNLTLKNEQVFIRYKEENQDREKAGDKEDFKFKKEIAFNRTKTTYLSVYYKNNLLIKQFEIGEWNEKEFDKVIASI